MTRLPKTEEARDPFGEIEEGREEEDTNDPEVYRLNLEKAKRMERLYEFTKRDYGENSYAAIHKGLWYADLLYKVSAVKAERLVTELLETSTRIFGPEHNLSVRARGAYEGITRTRSVMVFRNNERTIFDVIEYDRQNDSYVLTPTESNPDGMEEQHKRLQGQQSICKPRYLCALDRCVPVIVFGLPEGTLHHLNCKIGEVVGVRCADEPPYLLKDYFIQFEDDELENTHIPMANVIMLVKGLPPADTTDFSDIIPSESEVRWGEKPV